MSYKLQWTWFSQSGGVADIYLTTQVKKKDFVLWSSSNRHFSYAIAEKIDQEIERLGLALEGRGLREMMRIYNRERMNGMSGKHADEKAGIIGAKMRAGWKKILSKSNTSASDIFEEIGLDLKSILRADG